MVKIISKASSPAWQRSMAKATAQYQAGVRAKHLGGRTYEVPSATSTAVYSVEIKNATNLVASCTCLHGQHSDEPHCHHIALALCAAIERVSRKRPAPTTIAKPAARPLPPAASTEAGNTAAVAPLFPNVRAAA